MPKRGRESPAAVEAPPLVTVTVTRDTKGTEAASVKVDPSKYGFLSTQLQDEPYAQEYVNTDEVIADLSEAALGPELAADIATTLMFSDPLERVRLAARVLRGADYLQLPKELYLEQVVALLTEGATKDLVPPPDFQKEVVPCVHTGQLMWDRLGAPTVLRLEQNGIISLGHKGIIDAKGKRIDDELLALANVLNDVTALDISGNKSVTTCEPFADTLLELTARDPGITDEGLKSCTKLRKLVINRAESVISCTPFADTLEELHIWGSGITDVSLKCCRKLRILSICDTPGVTTCAPFADTLEELDVFRCGMTDDAIQDCTKLKKLDVCWNPEITMCDSFKDLEEFAPSNGFTAASLQKVAEQCCRLNHLDLCNCADDILTDGLLQKFAENCPLRRVYVDGVSALTDASIIALAENCPLLEELDVSATSQITDASIKRVAAKCPRLQELIVSGTEGSITNASIVEIAKNCRSLRHLYADETDGKVGGEALKLLLPSTIEHYRVDEY